MRQHIHQKKMECADKKIKILKPGNHTRNYKKTVIPYAINTHISNSHSLLYNWMIRGMDLPCSVYSLSRRPSTI